MDRAGGLHQSILEEAGAAPSGLGLSLGRGSDSDGMLLLTENEAELVHAANATPMQGFEEEYLHRLSTGSISVATPLRTGKRGRPPGSTTGSAAKRMAQQAEQVVLLSRAVIELQKQLREVREALATVVETQSNQSAVLAVLQQQLHQTQTHSHAHAHSTAVLKGMHMSAGVRSDENQSEAFQQLLA